MLTRELLKEHLVAGGGKLAKGADGMEYQVKPDISLTKADIHEPVFGGEQRLSVVYRAALYPRGGSQAERDFDLDELVESIHGNFYRSIRNELYNIYVTARRSDADPRCVALIHDLIEKLHK